jgi:hypothetical protein
LRGIADVPASTINKCMAGVFLYATPESRYASTIRADADQAIASVTADGAYEGMPTYDVVAGHGDDVRVIIPPHITAVLSAEAEHNPSQGDLHIVPIATRGKVAGGLRGRIASKRGIQLLLDRVDVRS